MIECVALRSLESWFTLNHCNYEPPLPQHIHTHTHSHTHTHTHTHTHSHTHKTCTDTNTQAHVHTECSIQLSLFLSKIIVQPYAISCDGYLANYSSKSQKQYSQHMIITCSYNERYQEQSVRRGGGGGGGDRSLPKPAKMGMVKL